MRPASVRPLVRACVRSTRLSSDLGSSPMLRSLILSLLVAASDAVPIMHGGSATSPSMLLTPTAQPDDSSPTLANGLRTTRKYAWVTLMYGNSRNMTAYLMMQQRYVAKRAKYLDDGTEVDHVIMLTPDVLEETEQALTKEGTSRVIRVKPLPLPDSLLTVDSMADEHGREMLMGTWGAVFTKLLIYNFTDYDRVALLDGDAFPVGAATGVFDACPEGLPLCAVQDAEETTPYNNTLLNAGLMVATPIPGRFDGLMEVLSRNYTFHPGTTTPEQTFLSDIYKGQIGWLSGMYNFGCHHPDSGYEFPGVNGSARIGFEKEDTPPAVLHQCGANKIGSYPCVRWAMPLEPPTPPHTQCVRSHTIRLTCARACVHARPVHARPVHAHVQAVRGAACDAVGDERRPFGREEGERRSGAPGGCRVAV